MLRFENNARGKLIIKPRMSVFTFTNRKIQIPFAKRIYQPNQSN